MVALNFEKLLFWCEVAVVLDRFVIAGCATLVRFHLRCPTVCQGINDGYFGWEIMMIYGVLYVGKFRVLIFKLALCLATYHHFSLVTMRK